MPTYAGSTPFLPETWELIVIGVVAFGVLFAAVAVATLIIVLLIKLLRDS
ncbi:hypothetical protein ACFQVD_27505 [Streptosporangium amethystogenes subsp. fukuiense]|uniref:Uncharacterized protein n=1 Tax=Streptosporangium amethystogenes subsp. fukuiense TaxID=698418 RepID=A0ABW2T5W2_9ACTN